MSSKGKIRSKTQKPLNARRTRRKLAESESEERSGGPRAPASTLDTVNGKKLSASLRQRALLQMQREHGNRYVQAVLRSWEGVEPSPPRVQRALTAEEKALNLKSPGFAGDPRLESAYDNSPPMKWGEKERDAVKKVQQALIDDGLPMPVSTKKTGSPDGIFGSETYGTVKKFQRKHGLGRDGVVGRETLGKMDELALAKPKPPEEKPLSTNELILKVMEGLPRASLSSLRKDKKFVDGIQITMSTQEFGRAAAILQLTVPVGVVDREAARTEALRILSAQLGGDKAFARKAIDSKIEVVIVPRNVLMTDLPQFAPLKGKKTHDGREWEPVRGVGNVALGGKMYTAITEENLLGVDCTATYKGKPVAGAYPKGYSTTSHEYAHALHLNVVDSADKKTVGDAYKARKIKAKAKPADPDMWVDGREGCYASQTMFEFFAQLSNAYLGTNAGKDPFTGDPRQNTKEWVKSHEPAVYKILDRIYGGASVTGTNPRK